MNPQASAVIGGGVMGGDVAAFFEAAGWNTQVIEPNPERHAALAWSSATCRTPSPTASGMR